MERMLLAGILGYGAGHLGFAGVRLKKRMTALLLNLILPLGILGTSNTTLEPGLYSGMALTVLFATLYYIFFHMYTKMACKLDTAFRRQKKDMGNDRGIC